MHNHKHTHTNRDRGNSCDSSQLRHLWDESENVWVFKSQVAIHFSSARLADLTESSRASFRIHLNLNPDNSIIYYTNLEGRVYFVQR